MDINFNRIRNTDFSRLKKKFWGISLTKQDEEDLRLFQKAIKLKRQRVSLKHISKTLDMSRHSIAKWFWSGSVPYSVRLSNYDLPNIPSGFSWLSLSSTRGGIFTGPWIKVPNKIHEYKDLLYVIKQLEPLPESNEPAAEFGINDVKKIKPLLFAYVLGVMLGDASKDRIDRSKFVMRRLTLRLTKFHKSNERMGNFFSLCLVSLGLRATRGKDMRPGSHNKHPFYTWHSQSSLLISWIFNICLGLKNTEVTTYHPIKADWLLSSPREFKIWFLHGLADSDGYVDFNSFQTGIISQPNTKFIQRLLIDLDVDSSVRSFNNGFVEAVLMPVGVANRLPLFSPFVESYRYDSMVKLANAPKLDRHMSRELETKIENYIRSGLHGTRLVKVLMENDNIRVRTKALRRVERKMGE